MEAKGKAGRLTRRIAQSSTLNWRNEAPGIKGGQVDRGKIEVERSVHSPFVRHLFM